MPRRDPANQIDWLFYVLSDAMRRAIIDLLRKKPYTTPALEAQFPQVSRVAVNQHVAMLRQANLIGRSRISVSIGRGRPPCWLYTVNPDGFRPALDWIRTGGSRPELPTVSPGSCSTTPAPDDEELERKLIEKFRAKGWDRP